MLLVARQAGRSDQASADAANGSAAQLVGVKAKLFCEPVDGAQELARVTDVAGPHAVGMRTNDPRLARPLSVSAILSICTLRPPDSRGWSAKVDSRP